MLAYAGIVTEGCRRFEGRVVAVTGAASGIGEACARRFAAEGAGVAIADVDEERGRDVAASIGSERALFVRCDVASSADWQNLREVVVERWRRLDVLHSNAFIQIAAPAHELAEDDWDRMQAVNLKAAYLGTKVLIDLLSETGGSIVLTSSVNALVGRPGRPAYAAAKAGLCALARQLAVEYGPDVRVNTVVPGAIVTPPWRAVPDSHRAASAAATAAKRLGEPAEIAAAVAFLASSDASYITGADLVVDGGWSVMKDTG
jgi:NAD(P)-dependent dehydrogenase (short-subunit alcohol dehydrogenase family)